MSYEDLLSLPTLNDVTIVGNKTFEDYGLVPLTDSDIAEIILEVFGYVL